MLLIPATIRCLVNSITALVTVNPDVVNNTKKIENAADLVLAKNLSNTGMALDDLLNTLGDADGVSSLNQILLNQLRDLKLPAGFKVEYIKASMQKLGGYNYDTKTLQINLITLPTMSVDDFATMIAHELIHTHTGNAIYDYQDGKLDNLTDEQIKAIQKLESLQPNTKEVLIQLSNLQMMQLILSKILVCGFIKNNNE